MLIGSNSISRYRDLPGRLWRLSLLGCVVALLSAIAMALSLAPSARAQSDELRSTTLQGTLPMQGSAHFLAVEPTVRDGVVILTLAYDPYDNPQYRGLVNFLVLDEDGLRRFIAGDDVEDLDLAAGSLLQFDPLGNKLRASFTDSGRGLYTVVVYNNAPQPMNYTLSAIGATLVDGAGQTALPAGSPANAPSAQPTPAPTATAETAVQSGSATGLGYSAVRARRVTGELSNQFSRHYFDLEPAVADTTIALKMSYGPLDQRALSGNVNFWVLDEDGLRKLIRGDDPTELELATGLPIPFSDQRNQVSASFLASGRGAYTIVTFNSVDVAANYALEAAGGVLVDLYGQTNESRAAAAEEAALQGSAPVTTPEPITATPDDEPDSTIGITLAGSSQTVSSPALTGALDSPYEHHYFALAPDIKDSVVVLTMDYAPRQIQELEGNINFWVVDEDGLRRILAGARPVDVDLAAGSPVQYGPDQGKLRAVFKASARGIYTVIVYNNSEIPAQYSIRSQGGLLEDASNQSDLFEQLP